MTHDVAVRTATAADTDRIVDLLRASLGETGIPRDRAYWEWKHLHNPFGESPTLVAEADGELVGLRTFMRWEWRAAGRVVRAARAVDTATHPEWQGKGIFTRLTKTLVQRVTDEGVHLIFNTPNEKSRPGYLKMGWKAVGRISPFVRPLRPIRLIRSISALSNPTQPVDLNGSDGGDFDGARAFFSRVGVEARPVLQATADDRLGTDRTLAYLRWRYGASPGIGYRVAAELGPAASALIVFRVVMRGRLRELRICELLAAGDDGSQRTARRLLRNVCTKTEADFVSAMAGRGTPEQRVLLRTGFLPAIRLGPIMTVRPLNAVPDLPDPLARRSWRLSIGDLELF